MAIGTTNVRYATEYQLDEINLITSMSSGAVSMVPYLVELNLFEDIYSSTITGQLVVSDALGIIGNFRLNGTEFLQVSLRKYNGDNYPIKRTFRVFSITNRGVNSNNAYETYTINFCSEEYMFSEQYRISKSYKNTEISDIITDILVNYVKVGNKNNDGTKKIYIQPTYGVYDFVLPNKKIFETINWLTTYARTKNNLGADLLFYESNNGYYLQSLQTLYQQTPYQTFYYNPKNISSEVKDQIVNVIDFEVLNFFDTLDAINNGTFSNKTITFDILTRTKRTNNMFDYNSSYGNLKHLNKYSVTNQYKNRRNDSMYQVMDGTELEMGSLRLSSGNREQKLNSWVINSKGGADNVANDIFIESYLKYRVAQLGLINYIKIKIIVPGDSGLTIGSTINFITYGVGELNENNERKPDPFYSGKYLVTAARHKIEKGGTYITVLELSKDSTNTQYPAFDNTNSFLKSIVNGVQ
jgi:hypothetical protein